MLDDMTRAEDQEIPLLATERPITARTPLPRLQFAILTLVMLTEPITFTQISPYIYRLIADLDGVGGEDQVGYYAGLLMSLFFAAEALTTYQWSKQSDRFGRKPILLIGLAGSAIAMICFGLSKTFFTLVISRCLAGLLNGNVGVMKTMITELTDETNRAQAFSIMPVTFAVGSALGPYIGGSLEHPRDKFPGMFHDQFWAQYPYFLPSVVAAGTTGVAFFATLGWLKEGDSNGIRAKMGSGTSTENRTDGTEGRDRSTSIKDLILFPIIIAIANYAVLAMIDVIILSILPIVYASPISKGGLGLRPDVIGRCLAIWGITNGLFQILFFAPIVRRLGERHVFAIGMGCYIPFFALFPIMNTLARKSQGLTTGVWVAVFLQLFFMVIADLCFGAIFLFIVAAAPPNRIGATNGLAQSIASISRLIGPALGASLLSMSIERDLLGGYAVYYGMMCMSASALVLTAKLPPRP